MRLICTDRVDDRRDFQSGKGNGDLSIYGAITRCADKAATASLSRHWHEAKRPINPVFAEFVMLSTVSSRTLLAKTGEELPISNDAISGGRWDHRRDFRAVG